MATTQIDSAVAADDDHAVPMANDEEELQAADADEDNDGNHGIDDENLFDPSFILELGMRIATWSGAIVGAAAPEQQAQPPPPPPHLPPHTHVCESE